MASWLPLSLCFLLLCHGAMGSRRECRVGKLFTLEPTTRVESEAGETHYFDQKDPQFECSGLAAYLEIIKANGLLLPFYSNSPRAMYVIQGSGLYGMAIPGCPETYRSFDENDQHQKVNHFTKGDFIAVPTALTTWFHNNGDVPVIIITFMDTGSSDNQLDLKRRQFSLAGSQQLPENSWKSIFGGFDSQLLADALGVDIEIVRKIQNVEPPKGDMILLKKPLQVRTPTWREEMEEEKQRGKLKGLDQAFCAMKSKENMDNPGAADVYEPLGGRLANLNGNKLPILNTIKISVTRGTLFKGASLVPHWSLNTHSAVYTVAGCGRIQLIDNNGNSVYDDVLHPGQLVIIPHTFVCIKQAICETFEWVSFKTHATAMFNQIIGKESLIRALPQDVILSSYKNLTKEEVRLLKLGEEVYIVPPRPQGQRANGFMSIV